MAVVAQGSCILLNPSKGEYFPHDMNTVIRGRKWFINITDMLDEKTTQRLKQEYRTT